MARHNEIEREESDRGRKGGRTGKRGRERVSTSKKRGGNKKDKEGEGRKEREKRDTIKLRE